jgi:hypothetical protein
MNALCGGKQNKSKPMFNALRRLFQRYGFHRETQTFPANPDWASDAFFTAHKAKTERLAAIARERDALKDQLAKAIKAKKARAPIYAKLRALSIEELSVEGRR